MITSEVVGLLSLLRELVSRKSDLDKGYFENFIQSTWDVFLKVHTAYKTAFTSYMELASKDKIDVESLLDTIRQDYIFTSDLRSELSKLVKNIPSTQYKVKEKYLADFANSIYHYFDFRESLNTLLAVGFLNDFDKVVALGHADQIQLLPQAFTGVYAEIKNEYKKTGRKGVKKPLEKVFNQVQNNFDTVAESYYVLRKELLS